MKSSLQLVTSSQVGLHLLCMKLNYPSNVKPRKLEFTYDEGLAKPFQALSMVCPICLTHIVSISIGKLNASPDGEHMLIT